MPLVDKQVRHDRIRMVSLGLYDDDTPIGQPHPIDWTIHAPKLMELGVKMESIHPSSEASVEVKSKVNPALG